MRISTDLWFIFLGLAVLLIALLCGDRHRTVPVIPTPTIPEPTVPEPTITTPGPVLYIILEDDFTSGPTSAVLSDPLHIPQHGTWIPYAANPIEYTLDGLGYAVAITPDPPGPLPTRNYGANATLLTPPFDPVSDNLQMTVDFVFPNTITPPDYAIIQTGFETSLVTPTIGLFYFSASYGGPVPSGNIEYLVQYIFVPVAPDPPVFRDIMRVTLPAANNLAQPFQRCIITIRPDAHVAARFVNIVDGTNTPIPDVPFIAPPGIPGSMPFEQAVFACYNNVLTPSIVPKLKFAKVETV